MLILSLAPTVCVIGLQIAIDITLEPIVEAIRLIGSLTVVAVLMAAAASRLREREAQHRHRHGGAHRSTGRSRPVMSATWRAAWCTAWRSRPPRCHPVAHRLGGGRRPRRVHDSNSAPVARRDRRGVRVRGPAGSVEIPGGAGIVSARSPGHRRRPSRSAAETASAARAGVRTTTRPSAPRDRAARPGPSRRSRRRRAPRRSPAGRTPASVSAVTMPYTSVLKPSRRPPRRRRC